MGQGVRKVLTFAISPVPIIAVILMLLSQRATVNGPMFVAGWALGLAVVTGASTPRRGHFSSSGSSCSAGS